MTEQPAPSGEAPAGFALFDAFDEPSAADASRPTDLESVHSAREAAPRRAPAEETDGNAPPSTVPIETVAAPPQARRVPLRFTWRMDRDGRFTPHAGEFTRLVGPRTTAAFGRPWSEIAATFGLDPDGRVMQAVATRATWSGITLSWPVDGGGRLPVELSGVPFFDAARNFVGYRGFGVCRDLDALARLAALPPRNCSAKWPRRKNRRLRHLPSRPASHRLHPTNCLNRLPKITLTRRDFCCRDFTSNRFGNRPWKPPRKIQKKASRKQRFAARI